MNQVGKKIMEIFRTAKVGAESVLKPQVVQQAIRSWSRPDQDAAPAALKELMEEGYLSTKEDWYVLTQKGYDYLYEGYSIENTKRLILDVFEQQKVGAGKSIMASALIGVRQKANRFDMDNFQAALEELVKDGVIEPKGNMIMLTEEGYKEVYRLA